MPQPVLSFFFFPPFAFLCLAFPVIVIVLLVLAATKRPRPYQPMSGGGSMGRSNQPYPPQQAAQAIYANLKSQGGLQPGRVYSRSYIQTLLPYPVYGYAEDWFWWQTVFAELNSYMMADGYNYPVSPYGYGGDAIYFGGADYADSPPMYYSDPTASGAPITDDPNAGFFDQGATDAAAWGTAPEVQDVSPFDQNDLGSQVDFGGSDNSSADSSSAFDGSSAGFDSSDIGSFDSGSGSSDG